MMYVVFYTVKVYVSLSWKKYELVNFKALYFTKSYCYKNLHIQTGVHWLSGRVLDSRPRGHRLSLTGITGLCP